MPATGNMTDIVPLFCLNEYCGTTNVVLFIDDVSKVGKSGANSSSSFCGNEQSSKIMAAFSRKQFNG